MKGQYNAECNRTACNNQEAIYYNHSTREHYCHSCAMEINYWNRKDSIEMFGHDLCTLVENNEENLRLTDKVFIAPNRTKVYTIKPNYRFVAPPKKEGKHKQHSYKLVDNQWVCDCGQVLN